MGLTKFAVGVERFLWGDLRFLRSASLSLHFPPRSRFSIIPRFAITYVIAQSRDESTFELQAKTPIKSFRFFLTQFKIGEPGVIKANSIFHRQ